MKYMDTIDYTKFPIQTRLLLSFFDNILDVTIKEVSKNKKYFKLMCNISNKIYWTMLDERYSLLDILEEPSNINTNTNKKIKRIGE